MFLYFLKFYYFVPIDSYMGFCQNRSFFTEKLQKKENWRFLDDFEENCLLSTFLKNKSYYNSLWTIMCRPQVAKTAQLESRLRVSISILTGPLTSTRVVPIGQNCGDFRKTACCRWSYFSISFLLAYAHFFFYMFRGP